MMLIAGDIGATTARFALTSTEAGPHVFIREQEFPAADDKGLEPIVEAFLADAGARADPPVSTSRGQWSLGARN
jgi:glucokinase